MMPQSDRADFATDYSAWISYVAQGLVEYDGCNADYEPIWHVTEKGRKLFHIDFFDTPIVEPATHLSAADKHLYDALCSRISTTVVRSVALVPKHSPKRRIRIADALAVALTVLIVCILL